MNTPALRVALFLLGYMLILFAASVPKGMAPARFGDVVWGVVAALAIWAMTLLFLSREQRTRSDVGLDPDARTIVRLLIGIALGFTVYAVTMALLSLTLGPIRFATPVIPGAGALPLMIASFFALSAMEELGFRGYALRTLVPAVGEWPAQIAIAAAFGLTHIAFGWPWPSVLLGVVPSALLFGVVAVRSGGLAMPIGLHAALNIAQWMVGAKDAPGIWALSVDPSHTERMAAYAPFVGMTITFIAAALIARGAAAHANRRRTSRRTLYP